MKSLSAALVAVLTFGSGFANAQNVTAPPVGAQPSDQPAAQAAQPSSRGSGRDAAGTAGAASGSSAAAD